MQEQQFYHNRETNTDPREQVSETPYGRSNDGKLRPAPVQRRSRGPLNLLLAFVVLAVLVGAALFATGQYSSQRSALPTRTFALTGHGKLVVKSGSGQVHIHRGASNSVSVKPTLYAFGFGSKVDPAQISYSQDGSTIKVEYSALDWSFFGGRGVDLDVSVPEAIDLDIQDGSGDVQIADVSGKVELKTGSGEVTANNLNGDIQLKTGSGDIKIANVNGQLEMETGSGSIDAKQVTLNKQGKIESGSGDIDINGELSPNASYRLQSGSGSIDLALPADSTFQLAADSGSGEVHNDFGDANNSTNDSLSIHTGSGDINIHKR